MNTYETKSQRGKNLNANIVIYLSIIILLHAFYHNFIEELKK